MHSSCGLGVRDRLGPRLDGQYGGCGRGSSQPDRPGSPVPTGYRGLDRGIDVKVPANAGGREHTDYFGPRCGQAQGTAEQDSAALAAHQNREAAGIRVLDRGQVDDELASASTKQAQELFAQRGRGRDVELSPERDDDRAVVPCRGGNRDMSGSFSCGMGHGALRSVR